MQEANYYWWEMSKYWSLLYYTTTCIVFSNSIIKKKNTIVLFLFFIFFFAFVIVNKKEKQNKMKKKKVSHLLFNTYVLSYNDLLTKSLLILCPQFVVSWIKKIEKEETFNNNNDINTLFSSPLVQNFILYITKICQSKLFCSRTNYVITLFYVLPFT